jgi:hypothetical protein
MSLLPNYAGEQTRESPVVKFNERGGMTGRGPQRKVYAVQPGDARQLLCDIQVTLRAYSGELIYVIYSILVESVLILLFW